LAGFRPGPGPDMISGATLLKAVKAVTQQLSEICYFQTTAF